MGFIPDALAAPLTGIAGKVPGDTLLDVRRLPHIDDGAPCVVEIVDTCLGGEGIKRFFREVRGQNSFSGVSLEASQDVVVLVAFQQAVEYSCSGGRVSPRAVAVSDFDAQAFRQAAEAIRPQPRHNPPAQTHRTQFFAAPRYSCLLEFLPQEGVIEMGIVGYEHFAL